MNNYVPKGTKQYGFRYRISKYLKYLLFMHVIEMEEKNE